MGPSGLRSAFHAHATTLRPICFVNSRSSVQIRVSAPLPSFVLRKSSCLELAGSSRAPKQAEDLLSDEDLLTARSPDPGLVRLAPLEQQLGGEQRYGGLDDLLSSAQQVFVLTHKPAL